MAKKRYFEDFAVGEVIKSRSHTVTEEEMRCYIKATDSAHPLHDDPEYCRAKGLKGIIIHGSMVLGLPQDETDAARALIYLRDIPGVTAEEVTELVC